MSDRTSTFEANWWLRDPAMTSSFALTAGAPGTTSDLLPFTEAPAESPAPLHAMPA